MKRDWGWGHPKRTPEERFWAKVNKHSGVFYTGDQTECWLWVGDGGDGYGRFRDAGRLWKPHKWLWVQENGPVPPGLELDHLCRQRACVRHLEPVTHSINQLRGLGKNQNIGKTHCPRNHEYDDLNTRMYEGRRFCRACSRERSARLRAA